MFINYQHEFHCEMRAHHPGTEILGMLLSCRIAVHRYWDWEKLCCLQGDLENRNMNVAVDSICSDFIGKLYIVSSSQKLILTEKRNVHSRNEL